MTVHNHPPYRPVCNERSVDGQLRGACLNDDGSPAMSADPTAEHIHWTSDAPTSLHGNGAASFSRVSRDIREVTCRLCHSLYPEHARERDAALAASLPAEVMQAEREAGAANALWNQANLVGHAIDQGRLDGTNGAAVAAAIRARTPEEFAKACGEVAP